MNKLLRTALLLGFACIPLDGRLDAQTTTENYSYTPNLPIPDNSIVGVSDSHVLSSSIGSITSLRVSLDITGGFNGDFYAYLVHTDAASNTGFAILLNRPGRTALNSFGYADSGINVIFQDGAANGDIHSYPSPLVPPGSPLTGLWQPDERNVNPSAALDTSPRTAFLSSFNGLAASGTWTLLVADLSPVGSGTFLSWGLEVTGMAVPEPASWVLATAGVALFIISSLRGKARRKRDTI
jgi:subtilisin-like proprotein convertase family protein